MRGLEIRADFAMARVLEVIDQDWAADAERLALLGAWGLGYDDYGAGISEQPPLFQGEPQLLREWTRGQRSAWLDEDMADRPGCASGEPCSVHD